MKESQNDKNWLHRDLLTWAPAWASLGEDLLAPTTGAGDDKNQSETVVMSICSQQIVMEVVTCPTVHVWCCQQIVTEVVTCPTVHVCDYSGSLKKWKPSLLQSISLPIIDHSTNQGQFQNPKDWFWQKTPSTTFFLTHCIHIEIAHVRTIMNLWPTNCHRCWRHVSHKTRVQLTRFNHSLVPTLAAEQYLPNDHVYTPSKFSRYTSQVSNQKSEIASFS